MKTTPDSRTIEKTKRRLRMALTELITEKHKEKVSVKDLTDKAFVSRATFYLHYENMEDFYSELREYIFGLFTEQIIIFMIGSTEKAKENSRRNNLIMSEEDRELFRVILTDYFDAHLYNAELKKVYSKIIKFAEDKHGKSFVEKNYEKIQFFTNGFILAMAESLSYYEPDKLYRDIVRSFTLWDYIAP